MLEVDRFDWMTSLPMLRCWILCEDDVVVSVAAADAPAASGALNFIWRKEPDEDGLGLFSDDVIILARSTRGIMLHG